MAARQQVPATAYRKNFPNFPTVVETKKKPDVGPGETAGPSVKPFRHPYMRLLDNFEPPEYQLKKQSEDPPRNVSKTPLIEISTREELEGLVKALEGVRHIAVHCTFATQKYEDELLLLGISTNTADYAIDVPTLGKENLRILQGVLANPDLVKVFISSRVCIYCLQQTLNLFLVNVFDLTSAAQKLGETLDIATHLKEKYGVILKVNIDPFDSSIRPLPDDVKNNCRYSTHYSLHMYRQFKNRLIDKSVKDYRAFLRQCNGACTIKHEVDKEGNFRELKERIERMQRGQLVIVEKLHRWREEVGRSIDKNPSDVLNTVRLKLLAVEMPESHEDILEIARSPHVEKDIEAVAKIVREAIKKYIRMDSTETVDQKKVDRDVEVVGASNQKRPVMPQSVNRKRKHDKKGKWSNSRNLRFL